MFPRRAARPPLKSPAPQAPAAARPKPAEFEIRVTRAAYRCYALSCDSPDEVTLCGIVLLERAESSPKNCHPERSPPGGRSRGTMQLLFLLWSGAPPFRP